MGDLTFNNGLMRKLVSVVRGEGGSVTTVEEVRRERVYETSYGRVRETIEAKRTLVLEGRDGRRRLTDGR